MDIEKIKCVFFHFLDGYINSDIGDTFNNVLNIIKNNKLVKNDIYFLNKNQINTYTFTNLKDGIENTIVFDCFDDNKTLPDYQIEEIKKYFKFCIIQNSCDKHSTSLLIFEENEKLYLFSFNSGRGIHKHEKIFNDYNNLYLPYICYKISDDITENFNIHDIFYIFSIGNLYDKLKVKKIYDIGDTDNIYYNVTDIEKYFKKLNNLTNHDFNFFYNLKYSDLDKKIINRGKKKLLKINRDKIDTNRERFIYSYYEFLNIIITRTRNIQNIDYQINPDILEKISKYDITNFNNYNKLKKIIHKITLHKFNTKLYIYSQESGSCSWFSIYWPILFYNILNNNFDNYIYQINNINNKFYKIISDNYKLLNIKNYNKDKKNDYDDYLFHKKIFNKLIDLNILDDKILNDNIDFIYDFEINNNNKFKINNVYDIFVEKCNVIVLDKYKEIDIKNDIKNYVENLFTKFYYPNNINILYESLYLFLLKENYKTYFFKETHIDVKYTGVNEYDKLLDKFYNSYNPDDFEFNYFFYNLYPQVLFLNSYTDNLYELNHEIENRSKLLEFIKIYYRLYITLKLFVKLKENIYHNTRQNETSNLIIIFRNILNEPDEIISDSPYTKIENIISSGYILYNKTYENIFLNYQTEIELLDPIFKQDNKTIDDYLDKYDGKRYFLYTNPKYIYYNFNGDKNYNKNERIESCNNFIEYNIFNIFEKKDIHDNLLRYHLEWYYDNYENISTLHLHNLQLLIYKLNVYDKFTEFIADIKKITKDKKTFIDFFMDETIIDRCIFSFLLNKHDINFNQYEFNNNNKIIINDKEYLLIDFNRESNFYKIFGNKFYLIENNKTIQNFIENNNYNGIHGEYEYKQSIDGYQGLSNSYEEKIHDTSYDKKIHDTSYDEEIHDTSYHEEIYDIGYHEEIYDIGYEEETHDFGQYAEMYIFDYDYIIKLKCINKYNEYLIIDEIECNNNKIEKYIDIIYPFKYIIPTNCFHIIYKQYDVYNIVFFSYNENKVNFLNKDNKRKFNNSLFNNNIYDDDYYYDDDHSYEEPSYYDPLDDEPLDVYNVVTNYEFNKGTYKFTINNNTNFYLTNMDEEKYMIWKSLCLYSQINKYNIIYISSKDESINGYYYNNNNRLLYNFKEEIYREEINNYYINEAIINYRLIDDNNNITRNIDKFILDCNDKSICKLIKKIAKYDIKNEEIKQKLIDKLINKRENIICMISNFTNKISAYTFIELLKNYDLLYNYLLNNKIIIFIKKLIDKLNNNEYESVYSLIKINNELFNTKKQIFNYNFEIVFELLLGFELLDEQMSKYIDIINSFHRYNNSDKLEIYRNKQTDDIINILNINNVIQSGGYIYPLHHIMMGKGKSKTLTPILTIYFSLKCNKHVIIMLPEHLKNQMIKTMNIYKYIFNLNFDIFTDTEIKIKFLDGYFQDKQNNKYIMLIDEFDSILDPLQSYLNIIKNNDKTIDNLSRFIYNHINNPSTKYDNIIDTLIISEINLIKSNIKNNIFNNNINWGIHPIKCHAIPYKSQNTPLLKSNFSSPIITIYLTYYYYYFINNFNITDNIIKFLLNNELILEIFDNNFMDEKINIDFINDFIKDNKKDYFDKIIHKILEKIKISSCQYNTSFVDILNINNIFKIGYSGTTNINLPDFLNDDKFDIIEKDSDEYINIKYAIIHESKIIYLNKRYIEIKKDDIINNNLSDYDALIDIIGFFKDYNFEDIAEYLNILFNEKTYNRDIIYMDNRNDIKVIKNKKKYKYDDNYIYNKPFIYYSNKHIIGTDINQEYYPKMKGLCIIDINVRYTIVAQSMYRLRKLNMGHSIDFLFLGKIDNYEEPMNRNLFDLLNINEHNDKENKKDFLILQTIKSIIRKKKSGNTFNKENYKEPKHYFFNLTEMPNYDYYELGIFTQSEIIKYNLINLFSKILKNDSYLKLIYNINSSIIEQQYSQEEEHEKEEENEHEIQIDTNKDYTRYENIKYFKFDLNFSTLNANFEDLKKYMIKINQECEIYFLANIFFITNIYSYEHQTSGYIFIYSNNKLYLIPGYMIINYINDYQIFNIDFKMINNVHYDVITKEEIDMFMQSNLFKLLNYKRYNITVDFIESIKSDYLSIYISFFILWNKDINNKSLLKEIIIDNYENIFTIMKSNLDLMSSKLEEIDDIFLNESSNFDDKQLYFKKYLKYKNKYLNYLNNM